jgi:FAD synthetase
MTRILIFGTYDGIHEGHRHFFAQARSLGDRPYLIASVARDVNVTRIKGRLPYETEDERVTELKKEILIDEVCLGSITDYIEHIRSISPDVIALGYDQHSYTEALSQKLQQIGLSPRIVRCDPYKPEIYKSSKLRTKKEPTA